MFAVQAEIAQCSQRAAAFEVSGSPALQPLLDQKAVFSAGDEAPNILLKKPKSDKVVQTAELDGRMPVKRNHFSGGGRG